MTTTNETLNRLAGSMDGLHSKIDGIKDDMSDIKVKVAKLEVSTDAHEREHERYNTWKSMSLRRGLGIGGIILTSAFGIAGIVFGVIKLVT
jgi:hypothetical protein